MSLVEVNEEMNELYNTKCVINRFYCKICEIHNLFWEKTTTIKNITDVPSYVAELIYVVLTVRYLLKH